MAVKDTIQYKLTKITTKTVMAGIVGVYLFLFAKPEPLWFMLGAVITVLGEWLRL